MSVGWVSHPGYDTQLPRTAWTWRCPRRHGLFLASGGRLPQRRGRVARRYLPAASVRYSCAGFMQLRHLWPAAPAYAACASARRGIHAASRLPVALRPPPHPYVVYLRHKCAVAPRIHGATAQNRRNWPSEAGGTTMTAPFSGATARTCRSWTAALGRRCSGMAQLGSGGATSSAGSPTTPHDAPRHPETPRNAEDPPPPKIQRVLPRPGLRIPTAPSRRRFLDRARRRLRISPPG